MFSSCGGYVTITAVAKVLEAIPGSFAPIVIGPSRNFKNRRNDATQAAKVADWGQIHIAPRSLDQLNRLLTYDPTVPVLIDRTGHLWLHGWIEWLFDSNRHPLYPCRRTASFCLSFEKQHFNFG
jgi:hypothetical protein